MSKILLPIFGTLLLALAGCTAVPELAFSPIPGAQTQPWPGAAAAVLRTSFERGCDAQDALVKILQSGHLLQTWTLAPHVPLEVHLAPGKYTVVALGLTNPDCRTVSKLGLAAEEVRARSLWLDKASEGRLPASDPGEFAFCPWHGASCDGAILPSAATATLLNARIRWDEPGGALDIRIKPLSPALRTGATPLHGEAGWSLERGEGAQWLSFGAAVKEIQYGLEFSTDSLQKENGFCVAEPDLMTMLLKHLRDRGHSKGTLKDFDLTWSGRIPKATRYCVYPQQEPELALLAPLEIRPAPAFVRRTWFLVVPVDEPVTRWPGAQAAILPEPKRYRMNAVLREPAVASKVEETGLVFLIQSNPPPSP